MEAANNFKQAELYYVSGNDWKTAVNMYRKADMWEEAYRVKSFLNLTSIFNINFKNNQRLRKRMVDQLPENKLLTCGLKQLAVNRRSNY